MRRLLREPLVHFLILGALLFAGYGVLHRTAASPPDQIVVSQGQLASMREVFIRTRQRPPTAEEWEGLIRARVREEVYYREALALGLDKDDAIIRRRLQQKMEFISSDVDSQTQPTDAELNAYLQTHAEKFRVPAQFTFRQVYLSPQNHGERLARDAARLLARLNQPGADARFAAMGDPILLDRSFTALPFGEVARQFGDTFATTLAGLPPGKWQGPVESAYGAHLVLLSERTTGGAPALADVRDAVRREWESAREGEGDEAFYRGLLKHYTVIIDDREPEVGEHAVGVTR